MPSTGTQAGHNRRMPPPPLPEVLPASPPVPALQPSSLADMSNQAERVNLARRGMLAVKGRMDAKLAVIVAEYMPDLKTAAKGYQRKLDKLFDMVVASSGEFVKPKSQVMADTKFGYRKQPDVVEFADPEADLIARVRNLAAGANRPDLLNLIAVKESISREVAEKLSDSDKALLGIIIKAGENKPFIAAVDADSDRVVAMALPAPAK